MRFQYEKSYIPSRDSYLAKICEGKKILHIGACDAPYTESKKSHKLLLHDKINAVAEELLGIDIDSDAIALMRSYGFDNIIHFDMNHLDNLNFNPDIILFGETIEHLTEFSSVFANFKKIMSTETKLVISTPNAFSLSNFFRALKNVESNHPEHTVFFSPRTLDYMLESNGFEIESRTFTFLNRKKERLSKKIKKKIVSHFPMLCETLLYECRLKEGA